MPDTQTPCPHCRVLKAASLWLCRACWRELPAEQRIAIFDTGSKRPARDPESPAEKVAKSSALGWLKLHSSAVL